MISKGRQLRWRPLGQSEHSVPCWSLRFPQAPASPSALIGNTFAKWMILVMIVGEAPELNLRWFRLSLQPHMKVGLGASQDHSFYLLRKTSTNLLQSPCTSFSQGILHCPSLASHLTVCSQPLLTA